jgi:threonine aldolase
MTAAIRVALIRSMGRRQCANRWTSTIRHFSHAVVDLRSDTVTKPTPAMLQSLHQVRDFGDDVYEEDVTVQALQERVAHDCGHEAALFLPTGCMANLVALLVHHDHGRGETIMGSQSHMALWEGGHVASLVGSFPRCVPELSRPASLENIMAELRPDNDVHYAPTRLVCLENTHNMLGGLAWPPAMMESVAVTCRQHMLATHLDGARLVHAAAAFDVPLADFSADSVTISLSKGLGAPAGSLLLGRTDFIRRARRARKMVGGGMRQVAVLACLGDHAWQFHRDRLVDDHARAAQLAQALHHAGLDIFPTQFWQPDDDYKTTNMVYFRLPDHSKVPTAQFAARLQADFGVRVTGGYRGVNKDGIEASDYFRAVLHLDINDAGLERAIEAILYLVRHG